MHKCFKCGTEFDGKFCPNCGSKWEENKTCPKCGANLPGEARFCTKCGYSFAGKAAENAIKPQSVMPQKVFSALRFLPFAALALFSVLLFAFFAAPVAEMVMGAGFPNVSLGNVYSMQSGILSELPQLYGSLVSLIFFTVIAFLYACAFGAVRFVRGYEFKRIKIAKFEISLASLLDYVSFIFYLIVFIIGVTVMGMISSADGGLGILTSGACPILLIVFSIVFALLAAGSLVARFLLAKKYPELIREEKMREERYIQAEKARKEHFYATHTAPVPPVETGKLKKVYNPATVIKQKRLALTFAIIYMIFTVGWLYYAERWETTYATYVDIKTLMGTFEFARRYGMMHLFYENVLPRILFYIVFAIPCFLALLSEILRLVNVKRIGEKKLMRRSGLIAANVLDIIAIVFYAGIFVYLFLNLYFMRPKSIMRAARGIKYSAYLSPSIAYGEEEFLRLVPIILTVVLIVVGLYMVVKNFYTLKAIKSFKKSNPSGCNKVEYLKDRYAEYHSAISAPFSKTEKKANKQAAIVYKYDKRRYDKAKEGKTSTAVIWVDLHKASVVALALLLVSAVILTSVLVPVYTNKFRISVLEKIETGFTQEQVVKILGKPDEISDDDYRWQYYSKEYTSILDKINKNIEEQEIAFEKGDETKLFQLMDKEEQLSEQLENITYSYIEICFANEENEKTVSSVFFDAARCDSMPKEKSVEDYFLLTKSYSEGDTIPYRTFFKDGSYYSSYATDINTNKSENRIELIWSDEFSKYSVYVNINQ